MKTTQKGLYTKKLGMTRQFTEDGTMLPITVLQVLDNVVLQVKTAEIDGYCAVKVGLEECKPGKLCKAQLKSSTFNEKSYKLTKELRLATSSSFSIGSEISMSQFTPNEKVHVQSITKGRGFTGTVKRFNFTIGPVTHGSKHHRRSGSNGAGTGQGKVWKGQKLPGHYGNEQVTVENLKVIKIIEDKKLLLVRGAVPGPNGSIVKVFN